MKSVLILILGLVLFGCGDKKPGGGAPPATDTTELHGNVAHVVVTGLVDEIHPQAGKFILVNALQDSAANVVLAIKAHPAVFLRGGAEVGFEALAVGQVVTVAGIENPGIIKADTVWLES